MMYSKSELVERKIMPSYTKYGGNILIKKKHTDDFVPRQYLTDEEYPKVPLVIQVLYSSKSEDGIHRLIHP